ncbi:putative response regulatory protein [compost metagenome]|uniref:response regulator transcription factor n=1 Tax=unclassified Paenibacillus TaxID=185978 RepID=UPI000FC361B6|nr:MULTISPECIES: response regulator [Paenibacillus]MUG86767.1 response regulator [Paenibacillus timonensis]GIP49634.1 DNA-binding response regulator [Paenibacillus sp. J53TS2]
MYKVLLADDEHLDLEGMRTFIPWSELGMEVVGAVSNGFSACELMERQSVDILVTDVNMPNMSGLELARRALDRKPDVRVVFVSGHQDFHFVKQALSLKACSYVLKPMDDEELVASLRQITLELEYEANRKRTEEQFLQMMQALGAQDGRESKDARDRLAEPEPSDPSDLRNMPGSSRLIKEIVATMQARLHENLTLKQIAQQFAFSPNYLGHLFKEETGQGFSEMLTELRMKRARELLRDPKVKIYEVAGQVGYRYMPYFSRQFKETFGMTPMEFRKRE